MQVFSGRAGVAEPQFSGKLAPYRALLAGLERGGHDLKPIQNSELFPSSTFG